MRIVYFIITSSLMIILMLLFRSIFRKKLSSNVIYTLWIILYFRLAVPFGYWEIPVFGTAAEIIYRPMAVVEQLLDKPQTFTNPINEEPLMNDVPIMESQSESESVKVYDAVIPDNTVITQKLDFEENAPSKVTNEEEHLTLRTIVLNIWFSGSLIVTGYVVIQNLKLRKKIENMDVIGQIDGIDICISKELKTPCLFGVRTPKILVTEKVLNDPILYKYAIMHELEHYKYKDHIWNLDRIFISILYWWNPLIWYSSKCVAEDAELACDERVLKNKSVEERKNYGYALLQMIENAQNKPMCLATSFSGNKNTAKQRIEAITRNTKTKKYILVPVVVILIIFTILGCVYPSEKSYLKTTDWEHSENKEWMITETEFPYSVQENIKSHVVYCEIFEYGELVKTDVLGVAEIEDFTGNIKLYHEFSKMEEDNKFSLEIDGFGIEMNSLLSNYPSEGGYAFSALQSDKKIEIVPEKSLILSAEFRTENDTIQTYNCFELSKYTEDALKEQFKDNYVVGLYRIVFSELPSDELYEKYSREDIESKVSENEDIFYHEPKVEESEKIISNAAALIKQTEEHVRDGYKEVKLTYVDNTEVNWDYYTDNPWSSDEERDALAQAALKELYTLTGFNVEECTYTTNGRSMFIFGKSASNIKKSIAFYSRDYGFTLCGDSTPYMGFVNARRVHYSDIQQLDSPYGKKEFSGHAAIPTWFLEHSGVYQGQKITGFETFNLDDTVFTHVKLLFDDGFYIVVLDEKIESVHNIMGPYYE